jgi:hypothetical protein
MYRGGADDGADGGEWCLRGRGWISTLSRVEQGQPEIQQLDTLLRHQDVAGFQVAVRDSAAVCRVERIQYL